MRSCLHLLIALIVLPSAAADRPNVLLIIADDLGYADLGCQHSATDVRTPNIDALAAHGVRFTNAYATSSMCAPSRAALLTGRYQQRFGFEFDVAAPPALNSADSFGLPKDELTIAERLKPLGYSTMLVGKWHLGFADQYLPTARGFDSFFGFRSGWHTYLPGGRNVDSLWRNREKVEEPGYLTDAFAREACEFIGRQHGAQFYLQLAFNAVHFPLLATPALEERVKHIAEPVRRTYAAVLLSMDDAIGKVMTALDAAGAADRTLVFFVNDNGGLWTQNAADNSPLRAGKLQVFEGGLRVPMIVCWKGKVPEGRTYDKVVSLLDIHATVLAATGLSEAPGRPLDGVDLVPYVTGVRTEAPHQMLYWRETGGIAVRAGDWKLLQPGRSTAQLYHLSTDIGEEHDLASKDTSKFDELSAAWGAWDKEMRASASMNGHAPAGN